ncbi:MAG: peroxiredoxin family protein, partial [Clostridia bacterium]|nr:peroxiredoxin family protein [Clostridia bacterium]
LRTMIAVFAICFSFFALVGCGAKKQPAAEITFSEYVNKPEATPVSIEIVYSSSYDGRTAYAPVTNEEQMREIYGILEGYAYELHEGEYLPPPGFMRSIKITYDDSSTVGVSIFSIMHNGATYVAKDASRLSLLADEIVNEHEDILLHPDFTVEVYGGEEGETFTLSEHRGKVIVVYFWVAGWAPCTIEMPYFERLIQYYPDDVTVLAVHEGDPEVMQEFIASHGWDEYSITFAQDEMNGTSGKVSDLMLRKEFEFAELTTVDKNGRRGSFLQMNGGSQMNCDKSYQTLKGIVEGLIEFSALTDEADND